MKNRLTEEDLLVFSACTSIMVIPNCDKLYKFIEGTLRRPLLAGEFALQKPFDECREILKDRYLEVLNKMYSQTLEE